MTAARIFVAIPAALAVGVAAAAPSHYFPRCGRGTGCIKRRRATTAPGAAGTRRVDHDRSLQSRAAWCSSSACHHPACVSLNVLRDDVVRIRVGDNAFDWKFATHTLAPVELARIAPPGFLPPWAEVVIGRQRGGWGAGHPLPRSLGQRVLRRPVAATGRVAALAAPARVDRQLRAVRVERVRALAAAAAAWAGRLCRARLAGDRGLRRALDWRERQVPRRCRLYGARCRLDPTVDGRSARCERWFRSAPRLTCALALWCGSDGQHFLSRR